MTLFIAPLTQMLLQLGSASTLFLLPRRLSFLVPIVLWADLDFSPGLRLDTSALSCRHLGSGENCVARDGW